jgi:hypothetical protein
LQSKKIRGDDKKKKQGFFFANAKLFPRPVLLIYRGEMPIIFHLSREAYA